MGGLVIVGLVGVCAAASLSERGSCVVVVFFGLLCSGSCSDETEAATDGGVVVVLELMEKAWSWISCRPLCSSAMSISIAARPSGEHLRALANLR